jgi:hypothetical protein
MAGGGAGGGNEDLINQLAASMSGPGSGVPYSTSGAPGFGVTSMPAGVRSALEALNVPAATPFQVGQSIRGVPTAIRDELTGYGGNILSGLGMADQFVGGLFNSPWMERSGQTQQQIGDIIGTVPSIVRNLMDLGRRGR